MHLDIIKIISFLFHFHIVEIQHSVKFRQFKSPKALMSNLMTRSKFY